MAGGEALEPLWEAPIISSQAPPYQYPGLEVQGQGRGEGELGSRRFPQTENF